MYKRYQNCGDLEETLMSACDIWHKHTRRFHQLQVLLLFKTLPS
ncbi:MAG: hypothetical protein ACI4S1_11740 [Roseburia sp.]